MLRGRKKKIIEEVSLNQSVNESEKKKKNLRKLFKNRKAKFIDTVTAYDIELGETIELNVYRVYEKDIDDPGFNPDSIIYMAVNSSFIDEMPSDLITTPKGVALIIDEENEDIKDEEEELLDY